MPGTGKEAITSVWRGAIAQASEALLRHAVVDVPGDSPDWFDSGFDLHAGETVTLLTSGAFGLAGAPEVSFGADLFLWRRIGPHGAIAKFPASTDSFTAEESGRLYFVANYPGAWLDKTGALAPDWPRNAATGVITVAILVWKEPAAASLALFAAKDGSGVAAEARARTLDPIRTPRGWGRCGASARRRFSANPSSRARGRASSAGAAAMPGSSNIRSISPSTRRRDSPGAGA
jgi:hypothetical protein